ncbi:MAG: carotenoid oxygenase family protein [Xanthobacteraceae bacterium]
MLWIILKQRIAGLRYVKRRVGTSKYARLSSVFAARPGAGRDDGWLIVQCLGGRSERAFFALFDAAHVDAGPIARIRLPHALPISFHGWWKAA